MDYKMSKFILKYFGRYCDEYFPGEREAITKRAEIVFDELMHDTPDMGQNMMTSNIDLTAAFFAYYEASDRRIGGDAIDLLLSWLSEDFRWVGFFTDMNKRPYMKPLYYKVYGNHAKSVEEHKAKGEWLGTWSFDMNPDGRKEGIYYHMKGCPLYQFVKHHGYEDMMPYICRFDFIFEKFLHAKLIRTQTEATGGEYCDYWFVPDQSETAKKYKDFVSV